MSDAEGVERVELLRPSAEPELPDAVIDDVARTIRRMRDVAGLQLAVAVGRLILDRFFDGDAGRMRSQTSSTSLRRLAAHPELPFSASTLSHNVAIFEVVERVGGVESVRHLTHSHLRHVIGLPESRQLELVRQADAESWPVPRVAEAARKQRTSASTGRPPLPRFVKAVTVLRKLVSPESDAFSDLNAVESLSPADAAELQETVTAALDRLGSLHARLQTRVRAAAEAHA